MRKVGETTLPTPRGDFRMMVFESILDQQTHIALVKGNIENGEDVLVRVQTHCLTGDVFGSPAATAGTNGIRNGYHCQNRPWSPSVPA